MNTDKTETILQNIEYQDNINTVKGLKLDSEQETIWATTKQIAELFDIDRTVVSKHILNIYKDQECDKESTCAKIAHKVNSQQYLTNYYNLDIIIAVGYRINSKKGAIYLTIQK